MKYRGSSDDYEQRFYAREYPLKGWLSNNPDFVQFMFKYGGPAIKGPAIKEGQSLCTESANIAPLDKPLKEGDDLTDYIRQEAFAIGFTMVGFRPYEPKYTYGDAKDSVLVKKNAIALGLEQPYEPTQKLPVKKQSWRFSRHM